MAYVIAEPCIDVKDRACVEVCPVKAIFVEDEVPAQWKDYIAMNADYYHLGREKFSERWGRKA